MLTPFKHFFPTPPLHSAALTVRGLAVREPMKPSIINRPRGTGDYLFMYYCDPVWIGAGQPAEMRPTGAMMIWEPGRDQYYGNAKAPFTHSWIHCDGTFVARLVNENRLPRNTPFHLPDPAPMERYLSALYAELTRPARPDELTARHLLECMMRDLARNAHASDAQDTVPPALAEARHFIETECHREVSLADLARRAHLSVSHFCAEFKKHVGVPAKEYLIRQRMHQAAYLLKDRNISVSDVGRRVGYEDMFHFSKLFKKHYGVSPRKYRG